MKIKNDQLFVSIDAKKTEHYADANNFKFISWKLFEL